MDIHLERNWMQPEGSLHKKTCKTNFFRFDWTTSIISLPFVFSKYLQNFEVGRSTIWYKKVKISFESWNNLILGRKKFCFVFVAKFQIFHEILWKFSKNKKFWAQKFQSLGNLSIFVSIFFESTRNGSIDGRKNAGAYKIML